VSCIADPADLAEGRSNPYDDWFELYNAGSNIADLTGCVLSDGTTAWPVPSNTFMPPLGFMLVWADEDLHQNGFAQHQLHAGFKLSAQGELIELRHDGTLIDRVTFGPQLQDISEGRWPDAAAAIIAFTLPSPGATNVLPEPTVGLLCLLLPCTLPWRRHAAHTRHARSSATARRA